MKKSLTRLPLETSEKVCNQTKLIKSTPTITAEQTETSCEPFFNLNQYNVLKELISSYKLPQSRKKNSQFEIRALHP